MLYKRSVLKNFSEFTDKHKKQSSGGFLVKRKDVLKKFAKFTEKHLFLSLFFNKVAGWKPETFRSSHWRCSVKQGALKNFASFTGNNLCWSLFLIKLHFWYLQRYQRRLQHEVLSCETSNYFEEHLEMSACKLYLKRDSEIGVFLWSLWII